MPKVLDNAASVSQGHGSLGLPDGLPLTKVIVNAYHLGLADGAREVRNIQYVSAAEHRPSRAASRACQRVVAL